MYPIKLKIYVHTHKKKKRKATKKGRRKQRQNLTLFRHLDQAMPEGSPLNVPFIFPW